MNKNPSPLPFLILCLAALTLPHAAFADAITVEERGRDARLEQKVTFAQNPVYAGELLDMLSKQSGVVIEARPEDHAADERFTVSLRDVKLGDALDAVWSFLSRKGAGYDWVQEPDGTTRKATFKYRFVRTGSARDYATSVRQQIQDEYEAQVNTFLAFNKATGEKQADLLKANPADALFWKDKSIRDGIGALADTLNPAEIKQLLRGEREISVPLKEASPSAQRMAQGVVAQDRELNLDMVFADPTHIHFATAWSPSSIAPTLSIGFGNEQTHRGLGYAGGSPLNKTWANRLAADWKLSGDRDTTGDAATMTRPIDAAKAVAPDEWSGSRGALAADLMALSQGANVSFFAGIPPGNVGFSMPGLPRSGETVKEYVDSLRDCGSFAVKWRGDILLVSLVDAPLTMAAPHAPWSVVKGLRAEKAQSPNGLVSVTTLFRLAHDLDAEQLRDLGEAEEDYGFIENILPWQAFWGALHRRPDLAEKALSPDGVAIAELPVAVRGLVRGGEAGAPVSAAPSPHAEATRVGVWVRDVESRYLSDPDYCSRGVFVSVWGADGKKKIVRGFGYENHPYKPTPPATKAKPTGP